MTINTYHHHSNRTRYSNRGPVIGLGGGRSPVTRRIGERGSSWSGRVRAQSAQRASDPSGRRRLALVRLACPRPPPPLESTRSISGASDEKDQDQNDSLDCEACLQLHRFRQSSWISSTQIDAEIQKSPYPPPSISNGICLPGGGLLDRVSRVG
jgi:hypothetical protein